MSRIVNISWSNIELWVAMLKRQILLSGENFTGIYGLPRGGLIPAVMLSHQLGIPLVDEYNTSNLNILVVDDIFDSGDTLKPYIVNGNATAVLQYRESSKPYKPRFIADTVKDSSWQKYPWERRDSQPIQDYKKDGNN